jgi:hypothetical protein
MGTVIFEMTLTAAAWSYSNQEAARSVEVEVELSLLGGQTGYARHDTTPTIGKHREAVERAARKIIDREGPNFTEPVRVTAKDILPSRHQRRLTK